MKIQTETTFLNFVWSKKSSPAQVKSVLKKITQSQAQAICEIVVNFLSGVLDIPPYIKKIFSRHKLLLRKLKSTERSWTQKGALIQAHADKILQFLLLTAPYVQPYLS